MLSDKKIFILLPDGVGLRNFIYTDFLKYGKTTIWTPLDYLDSTIKQLHLPPYTAHKMTDIFKSALIKASILRNYKKFHNEAYLSYLFPSRSKSFKHKIKSWLIDIFAYFFVKENGLLQLKKYYEKSIRQSSYYEAVREQLKTEKPSFIFCTNQRMVNAAAPVLAALELGIPTGTFIFSWDNMPKGNLSVPAEHLFVWSDYMKKEAKKYYPYIDENKVHVVGTPQFIPYADKSLYESREDFCQKYGLDTKAKLICFSGDDVTTSPYDPMYLEDTAKAVQMLNMKGKESYQILFRRCPVDVSGRYNEVVECYKDVIKVVDPLWEKQEGNNNWNSIISTREDVKLLVNTVRHCETAVNVGSTIAHDFACMGKTSCYLKYNVPDHGEWDIHKIYKFIHFQSMEKLDPIYWIDDREKVSQVLLDAINDKDNKMPDAQKWLEKIVKHPLSDANRRIWEVINHIVESNNACI